MSAASGRRASSPTTAADQTTTGAHQDPPGGETSATSSALPHYLDLVPKMTRLSSGDLDKLTEVARRLERHRQITRPPGERQSRITENTLIQLGVRLLLQRADQLEGTTADDLWTSLHS